MDIHLELTDDIKRAIRYLGYTKEDIHRELLFRCQDYFESLVARAKRMYAEKKTMLDIDPEPLS